MRIPNVGKPHDGRRERGRMCVVSYFLGGGQSKNPKGSISFKIVYKKQSRDVATRGVKNCNPNFFSIFHFFLQYLPLAFHSTVLLPFTFNSFKQYYFTVQEVSIFFVRSHFLLFHKCIVVISLYNCIYFLIIKIFPHYILLKFKIPPNSLVDSVPDFLC